MEDKTRSKLPSFNRQAQGCAARNFAVHIAGPGKRPNGSRSGTAGKSVTQVDEVFNRQICLGGEKAFEIGLFPDDELIEGDPMRNELCQHILSSHTIPWWCLQSCQEGSDQIPFGASDLAGSLDRASGLSRSYWLKKGL